MNGRRAFTVSSRRSIAVAMLTAAVSLTIFSGAALGATQQPTNTVAPAIAGTFKPGQVLTASPGQWSEEPSEFKYRWEVCDPTGAQCKIVREFSPDPSYLLEPRNALGYIRVQVVASNSFGSGGPAASALQKWKPPGNGSSGHPWSKQRRDGQLNRAAAKWKSLGRGRLKSRCSPILRRRTASRTRPHLCDRKAGNSASTV